MFKRMIDILWKQNPKTDINGYEEPDPTKINVDNAYKTRWIWYHTILGLLMFFANIVLFGIFILLAIKL